MTRYIRALFGVLYKTFASWQIFGDRSAQGETAAGLLGLLLIWPLSVIVDMVWPATLDRLLSLPGPAKLLIATLAVLSVGVFFRIGGRGWRWAKEAEIGFPRLYRRGNWIALGAIALVVWFMAATVSHGPNS